MSTLPTAANLVLEAYGVTNAQPGISWLETQDETFIKSGLKTGAATLTGTTGSKAKERKAPNCLALMSEAEVYGTDDGMFL
jgi:hypothetical protein